MPTHTDTPAIARNAAPYLHGPETAALTDALIAGQYGHNTETEAFERELADHLGVVEVVTTHRGTAALHMALMAAGIGRGDEVVVPSQTFCATIHAIRAAGGVPRFADIDPTTQCVTPDTVDAAITVHTRAVLPVFYGGRAVDLTELRLADREIAIVEDAAHAFGSRHSDGCRVGATGQLTCFSFGPIKNITCLEGGAIVARNRREVERLRALRTLGIRANQLTRIRTTDYRVDGHGLPYHLSAVHAAVGRVQLAHFDKVATLRTALWRSYAGALAALDGVELVDVDIDNTVPFNLVVLVDNRDEVFARMRAAGIGVGVHYPPNHTQPAFERWYRRLPATEHSAPQLLSLPFHPAMTEVDVTTVVDALAAALTRCG
ncbi:DegT/DnrJ/EryC1/StrS family aminotransferase [Nocardia puris]|uniref:DegT/DnrJ/EryC1/StrS family aminotransferase n=1 Tax=Nocardia puris TaxID=208602 RepID=UPI001894F639|nr:DegT/DnrJ/EryC1/StrS family aminotransferase [Nocardia puris]MBF6214749.1 DegT/DnrJ/EryC1/StrS family aminotransferase [Nocardia puris]MBF6368777.1 DegT/DnrJ/EryC1/StrS family aminotransferase [Nocardia puris]MBF6462357.1 DegT/DnrJ/EryC1/StrS family aminotransferase [Nocardia puris]